MLLITTRTSTLVKTIDFPKSTSVLNGVAFGGPQNDILYVIAASNNINPYTLQPIPNGNGSSIYTITGLNAVGTPSSQLQLH